MKRILITGKDSYIGNNFKEWVSQWSDKYQVDVVSTRDNLWKEKSFSGYNSILHVAGIAHNSSDKKLKNLYYQINRDLTYQIALKAKEEGVEQFVFMSSMIVYGTQNERISKKTALNPDNFYGDSKLQAEKKLVTLENNSFKVAIIRPPMVYGKGSKGNYPKLSKLARITPIFPEYKNKRSMIHIINLCEFLRLVIDNEDRGVFHPQNSEYVETSNMVKSISKVHNKKIRMVKIFNPLINKLSGLKIINKVFGNLFYDLNMSVYSKEYTINNFEETIILAETIKNKRNDNI